MFWQMVKGALIRQKNRFALIALTVALGLSLAAAFVSPGGEDKKPAPKPASNKIDLSNAKDGTYTIESSRDEKLGNSILTLTIKDKKIVAAEFIGYDLFGNVKGEDYGSLTGKDSADYRKVDAISGANISYGQFVETTKRAIEEASK